MPPRKPVAYAQYWEADQGTVPFGIAASICDCAWHAERARRLSAILLYSIVRLRVLHSHYDDIKYEMPC